MFYETVIGLEVHVQLKTESKIFCSCSTQFGEAPNVNICPICTGMPGVLPVLNEKVVELALKVTAALNCRIKDKSIFARKNYFYPDLPKNYQISQYDFPLAENGYLEIGNNKKRIDIIRVHLEEDAGKLLHSIGSTQIDGSLVDFNRCGIPLLEIVSEAQINSPQEAYAYLQNLKSILKYIEVSDCNMEEGSLRCDANVSLRPEGREMLGVKTEVKNMNSFKGVEKALEYEVKRQTQILTEGKRIIQETRLWDEKEEKTSSMRSKEEAHDYRYFPEPDLVPLVVKPEWIAKTKEELPELPQERRRRFVEEYNLSNYDTEVITAEKALADYYEECVKGIEEGKKDKTIFKIAANWVMGDLLGHLNTGNMDIKDSPVTTTHLASMLGLLQKGVISGKIAKTVFEEMFKTGKKPEDIIKEKGLVQISDEGQIEKIIDEVIADNPKVIEEYKSGKEKVLGFLVGQVMKKTKGKCNPQIANKFLKEKLK